MSAGLNFLRIPLLQNQTVDETASDWVDCRGYQHFAVYVIGVGTTSSGVITIDECDFNPATEAGPTATAAVVGTVNASAVSAGLQAVTHFTGCYGFVRTRISTVIGGGGNISTVIHATT
jgi:hypothetical protein